MKDLIKKTHETYSKFAKRYHLYNKDKVFQFQMNYFLSLLPKNSMVLDAGCGTGRDSNYLNEEGCNVIGIDVCDEMLKEAKEFSKNTQFKKMDLLELNFKEKEFDGIWAMASIYHIPKKQIKKVLKDFNKILKQSGILYLSAKEGEGESVEKDKKYEDEPRFIALYQKEELEDFLKSCKFKILKSEVSVNNKTRWIEIFCQKI